MEEKFVEEHMDAALEGHLKDCLRACLPGPLQVRDLAKALVASRSLVTGPVWSAASKTTEQELSGCVNLLQDMMESRSPSASDLANMNELAVQFMKRCESCCVVTPSGQNRDERKQTRLFGKDAIDYQFDKCMSDDAMVKTTLKTFRMFRWLLTEGPMKKVEECAQKELIMAKNKYLGADARKALEEKSNSARGSNSKHMFRRKKKQPGPEEER